MSWIVQLAIALVSGVLGGIGSWYRQREKILVLEQRLTSIEALIEQRLDAAEARITTFQSQLTMLHDIDKKLAVALEKLERLESVAFPSLEHAR